VYLSAWFVTDTIREVDWRPDDPAVVSWTTERSRTGPAASRLPSCWPSWSAWWRPRTLPAPSRWCARASSRPPSAARWSAPSSTGCQVAGGRAHLRNARSIGARSASPGGRSRNGRAGGPQDGHRDHDDRTCSESLAL